MKGFWKTHAPKENSGMFKKFGSACSRKERRRRNLRSFSILLQGPVVITSRSHYDRSQRVNLSRRIVLWHVQKVQHYVENVRATDHARRSNLDILPSLHLHGYFLRSNNKTLMGKCFPLARPGLSNIRNILNSTLFWICYISIVLTNGQKVLKKIKDHF
jgi:hypothetical protein